MTPERKAFTSEMYTLLSRLARSVGHDLRNPLGLITHAVYLLKMQIIDGDPQALETADMISVAVNDAERILDGLRDYVCAWAAESTPYHIQDILRSAMVQISIPDTVTQQVIVEQNIPMMMVDGDQLLVAFRILLEYCLNALPNSGTLNITLVLKNRLEITFTHSGQPLTEDQCEALFDPFVTPPAYGSGLELALVQLLIEAQNGSISTTDGTRFLVDLPMIETEYSLVDNAE